MQKCRRCLLYFLDLKLVKVVLPAMVSVVALPAMVPAVVLPAVVPAMEDHLGVVLVLLAGSVDFVLEVLGALVEQYKAEVCEAHRFQACLVQE
mmetsp:Transcript_91320/g.262957  ORF Transcript_91320/g.262957 Transcript_91320/m.262957 type:complete len:93 (-) Transcript_91320:34-312(-)